MRTTPFKIYCDHKSLIQVFALCEELKAHSHSKLMPSVATTGGYRYHNLCADMMSGWGQPTPSLATNRVKIRRGHGWSKKIKTRKVPLPAQPKLRRLDKGFVWPCVADIRQAQDQNAKDKPK
ncbi:hypothetical protein H257_13158 [Aphanomyces astaci]|uniref:Reverse transcriptase RNase H-like domain-containing protein n=1 Tax=Aphanomyces astaci TaxID=112090 RepID=W4FXP6_APHAT|nr:hypothetical protein H257_13158 [Aphanomyces astaci]ETV71731.1 hypothetical protein H257_13158 [Aphanomyces astaci]|eukprot:XP_009838919.1 hypothetical protein H257_13158 [Aphanomyces astaci]